MPGPVFLKGEEINLRTRERKDIPWMRDMINEKDIRRSGTNRYPMNEENEKDFFERNVVEGKDCVHLIIAKDGERKGFISLIDIDLEDGKAEIGLAISVDEQGKGYGTEASRLMTDYGFRELRLHRIYAGVFAPNPRSVKIWEGLGYKKECVMREHVYIDGEYRDKYIFGILREEWRSENYLD